MGLTIIHRPTSSLFGQPAAALDDVVMGIPFQIPHSSDTALKQRMEKYFLRRNQYDRTTEPNEALDPPQEISHLHTRPIGAVWSARSTNVLKQH